VITFLLISKFGIQYRFFSTEAIVQTYFDILMLKRHTTKKEKLKLKSVSRVSRALGQETHGRLMIYMLESLQRLMISNLLSAEWMCH